MRRPGVATRSSSNPMASASSISLTKADAADEPLTRLDAFWSFLEDIAEHCDNPRQSYARSALPAHGRELSPTPRESTLVGYVRTTFLLDDQTRVDVFGVRRGCRRGAGSGIGLGRIVLAVEGEEDGPRGAR